MIENEMIVIMLQSSLLTINDIDLQA